MSESVDSLIRGIINYSIPNHKKRAPIKRPNRFGLSNQLNPFCTPANIHYKRIIQLLCSIIKYAHREYHLKYVQNGGELHWAIVG